MITRNLNKHVKEMVSTRYWPPTLIPCSFSFRIPALNSSEILKVETVYFTLLDSYSINRKIKKSSASAIRTQKGGWKRTHRRVTGADERRRFARSSIRRGRISGFLLRPRGGDGGATAHWDGDALRTCAERQKPRNPERRRRKPARFVGSLGWN